MARMCNSSCLGAENAILESPAQFSAYGEPATVIGLSGQSIDLDDWAASGGGLFGQA
jgi:hypothetical protein